ncbi:conserved oligomeric Golgi complex subunit 1 [Sabethes cyaneus]|uniref:conserved oligomeric Golgi complex subunit 1 n=1 Tax=Sabethes cyaneus TaxID=53552 RepID=UPI00221E2CF7|nr:conserved oligomeric Golgi complex subunit 1 [Sabethes cyaneus]
MANINNLLNINVDKLFEQYTVSEIDHVHKRLQAEVELKREELRTMVGERYRDLLKAADTIGDMNTTANSIIGNIDNVTASCRQLHDHQLIGFRSTGALKKNTNNKFHGIVVQIKLLTSLPEMIWSAIDSEEYFVATQLFIFSRHISTGLQLDSNSELMAKFPVAKKQWAVLSQFFFTIKQNCSNCLEREDLDPEVASKCLASLLLLENCQQGQILSAFVQMRLKAFSAVLSDNSKHEKVKDKIVASLKLLMNTVDLIYKCFIGTHKEPGLLVFELMTVTSEDSNPTIALIKSEDQKIIQTLPDIIRKFRPRLQLEALNSEVVRNSSKHWLESVEKIATHQLASFMNLVPSIKMLHDVRKLCLAAAKKPELWEETCRQLSLDEGLDFYKMFYQPLIDNRVKTIIKACWSEIVQNNSVDILNLLKIASIDKTLKDVKSFVWTESADDNPPNLKDALDSTNLARHHLLMKTRAFPPPLVRLASLLDQRIQVLSKDVCSFLASSDSKEVEPLLAFYSECSAENMSQLITSIKSADYKQTSENHILIARLLVALKELCPSLKQCLTPALMTNHSHSGPWQEDDYQYGSGTAAELRTDRWAKIAGLLDDECLRFWKLWSENFEGRWPQLNSHVGYQTLLVDFPLWNTVSIEENDEHNQPVQSTIRIPAFPTFSLQRFLHVISTQLSHFIPHTIPKAIIAHIVERILQCLDERYSSLSTDEFVKTTQNSALQYYFDLKFIQALFTGGHEPNRQFTERCNLLLEAFRNCIDPFDFDVFHPHLNANVKHAVQRMQHFYGVLNAGDQFSTAAVVGSGEAVSGKTSQDKNPNILAVSSNSASETWFPLLPIVTKESSAVGETAADSEIGGAKTEKVTKQSLKEINLASKPKETLPSSSVTAQNYAKGAAAFFGLDKDWFK